MRRVLLSAAFLIAVGAALFVTLGASNGPSDPTYKVEVDNAFGLVTGADFKVAGVKAGKISSIELPNGCIKGDPTQCHALVTVQVQQTGFGQFRSDAFCQTRPQSLIGEYFVECEPGHNGKVLKAGSTIPVNRTQSTIPADLLQNVMRMPYRERFTLIINELGAAAAARSGDLQAALQRAVPALTETDNLLNLLANDSHTLQALTVNSDTVVTALANNSHQVQRFIDEANRTATATATQQANLQATWHKLPGFLEQLRPALQKLGVAATTNLPVLNNLNAASGQIDRLFTDLPPFSRSARPAIKSLGKASVTGRQAVIAARSTVHHLNTFAKPTPELAQNLAIVLHDLDDRSRAVEADSRSPGGQGYTGLEALLQYVFNQTLAINGFGQFGHFLAVDAFVDPRCSPYATQLSIANGLHSVGSSYRECYAWLGPNQPGINETDPSNPGGCVPDPGAQAPYENGPNQTPTVGAGCKLSPGGSNPNTSATTASTRSGAQRTQTAASAPATAASGGGSGGGGSGGGTSGGGTSGGGSSGSGTPASSSGSSPAGGAAGGLQSTLGKLFSALGGGSSSSASSNSAAPQTNQLLNYLLAP
jgi:virulence factor Mce-like protein